MPLRALIDGREIIAPLLSEAEWESLRREVAERGLRVGLPCCEVEGYLRSSRYGTQHFAHKRGSRCRAAGETVQHLKAKADVVLACRSVGYSASTEVAGSDWRADILAERGTARIAFEIQWSFLRLDDALRRQRRYARDGVRGCWLFRRPPPPLLNGDGSLRALHELPLFHLLVNADLSFSVALNGRLYRLPAFVRMLLGGAVRFCETARLPPVSEARLQFFPVDCPACGATARAYRLTAERVTACGLRLPDTGASPFAAGDDVSALAAPAVAAALAAYRQSAAGRRPLYELRPGSPPALICPHCKTPLAPARLALAHYGTYLEEVETPIVPLDSGAGAVVPFAHWCAPDDGGFCCG